MIQQRSFLEPDFLISSSLNQPHGTFGGEAEQPQYQQHAGFEVREETPPMYSPYSLREADRGVQPHIYPSEEALSGPTNDSDNISLTRMSIEGEHQSSLPQVMIQRDNRRMSHDSGQMKHEQAVVASLGYEDEMRYDKFLIFPFVTFFFSSALFLYLVSFFPFLKCHSCASVFCFTFSSLFFLFPFLPFLSRFPLFFFPSEIP